MAQDPTVTPEQGFVPDEKTAERIAEAVLIPIYGQQETDLEKPFKTKLSAGVWIVRGYIPPNILGGVFEIKIKKENGEILHLTHGR
jgi:hypothetical protein